jgi:hypothetical protein
LNYLQITVFGEIMTASGNLFNEKRQQEDLLPLYAK